MTLSVATYILFIVTTVVNAGIGADEVFSKIEPFAPTKGSVIGNVMISDEMHFEMDIVVHSLPTSGSEGILHCGTKNHSPSERYPAIFLYAPSTGNHGFNVRLTTSDTGCCGEGPNKSSPLNLEQSYHLEVEFTQSWLSVEVDGESTYFEYHGTHTTGEQPCYASAPWYAAADVTVSNFRILSGIPIPTAEPTTAEPTTAEPTTAEPTTAEPTAEPTDGTSADEIFSKIEPFTPTKGSVIGNVMISDEMHFEMDIVVHSLPTSGTEGILHCGTKNHSPSERYPAIFLYAPSTGNYGFNVRLTTSDTGCCGEGPNKSSPLNLEQSYHLEVQFTQSWLSVAVDGESIYFEYHGTHTTGEQPCYASAPWYAAADVTISNFRILSAIPLPTAAPTTAEPTTAEPTTAEPTTSEPTAEPTDGVDEVFSKIEPFAPTKGSVIGTVMISDEMHFEMDIVVHSHPTDVVGGILHCGTKNHSPSERYPAIFLYAPSTGNSGFNVRLTTSDTGCCGEGPNKSSPLNLEQSYHLEVEFTQNWLSVKVDGESIYFEYHGTHTVGEQPCYASAPWYAAADVTISNFRILAGVQVNAAAIRSGSVGETEYSADGDADGNNWIMMATATGSVAVVAMVILALLMKRNAAKRAVSRTKSATANHTIPDLSVSEIPSSVSCQMVEVSQSTTVPETTNEAKEEMEAV